MTEAYSDLMIHLITSQVVAKQHLYDFSYKRLESVYDHFYDFFNDILQEQAEKLGFPPSYLYFVDDEEPNAYASSPGDFKKIGIHYGAIEKLYEFFEHQEDLLATPTFDNVRDLLSSTGHPVHFAFIQYYYTFLFYHEYAHLVQRSPIEPFTHIEYNKTGSGGDILEKHAREQDADWLAANCLAIQVVHHLRDENGNFVGTPEQLEDLASVALTSVFCYRMKTAGYYQGLYFLENDHPHPYARLLWMASEMLQCIKAIVGNIPFNLRAVVNKAFGWSQMMLKNDYGAPAQQFQDEFNDHFDEIVAHIELVLQKMKTMPFLCYNRQNEVLP